MGAAAQQAGRNVTQQSQVFLTVCPPAPCHWARFDVCMEYRPEDDSDDEGGEGGEAGASKEAGAT